MKKIVEFSNIHSFTNESSNDNIIEIENSLNPKKN